MHPSVQVSNVFNRFRSNITDVTVIRSVSDAVEPSSKYSSMRRCNGFLRRPEILETVYSVEEDGDSENNQDPSESTENSECEERRTKNLGNGKGRLQDLYGSFERLAQEADSPPSERPRDESQQAQVCNFSFLFCFFFFSFFFFFFFFVRGFTLS